MRRKIINDNGAASASAKIDGVVMTAYAPTATRVTPPGSVTIAAVTGNEQRLYSQAIYLNVTPTGTGTITLGSGDNSATYQAGSMQFLTALSGGNGVVKITRFDPVNKVISGTFSFVAHTESGQAVNVTDGAFTNVKWSEQ